MSFQSGFNPCRLVLINHRTRLKRNIRHNSSITNHSLDEHLRVDRKHLWHPYTSLVDPTPLLSVSHAEGCTLYVETTDGNVLPMIDGMSSWWAAIWGYNHPKLNQAVVDQLSQMSHVMFGGLTHRPATNLASNLLQLVQQYPHKTLLDKIFYADSGSVAVEVSLKMALQYWRGKGSKSKTRFLSLRGGYHGDTFGAMSVCDPVGGMHSAFSGGMLAQQIFVSRPPCDINTRLGVSCSSKGCNGCTCKGNGDSYEYSLRQAIAELENTIQQHHESLAAFILEPLVQGAGGMRFYAHQYLQRARELCDEFNVLLICDEIATGFGRSGGMYLFASHNANIQPDIMCLGKALTGGYMTMGVVLTSEEVAYGVSASPPTQSGKKAPPALPLMHGPTFMGNPLACSVAAASTSLMLEKLNDVPVWKQRVDNIEFRLAKFLEPAVNMIAVADVRVKGAIGVIELNESITSTSQDQRWILQQCQEMGVWLRPFGRLLYTMPPYLSSEYNLERISQTMLTIADKAHSRFSKQIR